MEQFDDNLNYLKTRDSLIGREEELEEIMYRINSGNMLLIEGEKGIGKTTLLEEAIDNFKGKGKVIYINVKTFGKRFDISNVLIRKPKEMILLIDDIEHLSEENNKKIKYFYDQDYFKSVVFTTTDAKKVNFTDAIKSRIGRNIIKLEKLSESDSLVIAKERLEDEETISEEILKELYDNSKNIKEFLGKCNSLCKYLNEKDKEKAELKDLRNIGEEELIEELDACSNCDKELIEINGIWRCENCDNFCKECGSLYDEEDMDCPSCGKEISEEEL